MKKIARLIFVLSIVLMFSSPVFLLAQSKPEVTKVVTHTRDRFLSATVWIKSEATLNQVNINAYKDNISVYSIDIFGDDAPFTLESPNMWRVEHFYEMDPLPPGTYTATVTASDLNRKYSDPYTFTFTVLQNTYLPIMVKP